VSQGLLWLVLPSCVPSSEPVSTLLCEAQQDDQ
jgi:hypothetical protein